MASTFKSQDAKKTWKSLAKKLIKPHFRSPSSTKAGVLESVTPPISFGKQNKEAEFLKQTLKHNKGTLDLPAEALLGLLYGQDEWYGLDGAVKFALQVFMFAMKITVVSPETYYGPCPTTCPTCDEPLKFERHGFDNPMLVMGMFEANEVVIPMYYKCKNKHSFSTVNPGYLEQLSDYVRSKYPYLSTCGRTRSIINTACCNVVIQPHGLTQLHNMVKQSKIYDFAKRVEDYMLFIDSLPSEFRDLSWPLPPNELVESSSGGVPAYFCLSEQTLRDIRLSCYASNRKWFAEDMQATKIGRIVAFDWSYKPPKHCRSSMTNMNFGIANDGPDKGRVFGFSVHAGSETHYRSKDSYEGYLKRFKAQGNRPEYAVVDKCCDGSSPARLKENDHPLSRYLGLKRPPFGDAFHLLENVMSQVVDCEKSAEFRADLHSVLFEDVGSLLNSIPDEWLDVYESINKDGSMKCGEHAYSDPGLFARKLIALSTCFEDELDKQEFPEKELSRRKKVALLNEAIRYFAGSYCPYVPQIFRKRNDMIAVLNEFSVKWLGCEIEATTTKPFSRFKSTDRTPADFPNVLTLNRSDSTQSKHVYVDGEESYVLLKVRGLHCRDSNGMLWKPVTSHARFARALAFQPGQDKRVLGKWDLPSQVQSFAKHIFSGCFDYGELGEGIYREAEKPVAGNTRFKGLVKVVTSAGQNMVENTFKHVNEVQHGVASYTDEECEARVSISCLSRNFSTDVRHGLTVPPTPHVWVWHRLNELSRIVFKQALFTLRRPQAGLPFEPLLAFNSYRFEILQNVRKIPRADAEELCVKFELPQSSKFRWPTTTELKRYKRITVVSNGKTITVALETQAMDAQASSSVKIELLEEDTEQETNDTPSVSSSKPEANEQGSKRRRESAGSYIGFRNKRVTVSNDQYAAKSFKVVNALSTKAQKKCLDISIAEVALENPKAKEFCRAVAVRFNEKTLANTENTGPLASSKKDLPKLLSIEGVSKSLLVKARALSSTKSSKTKRGKQANQMKPAPYPLTIDNLLSGEMTFVNAQKYFKSLKDLWTVETCAAGRGFRMASKDVKGLTRQRNALIHGLRIIFAKHNLLSIDHVQSNGSGMFHPVYVQGGGSLRFYMKDDQSSIPSKTTIPSNVDYVITS